MQLEEVHELQAEDEPAEERKSPPEADPLLKPKVEKSFLIFLPPQEAQHCATSALLRAKCSKVPPHSSHLYSKKGIPLSFLPRFHVFILTVTNRPGNVTRHRALSPFRNKTTSPAIKRDRLTSAWHEACK